MRDVRENDGLMVKIVAVLIMRKINVVSFLRGFIPYFCCFPSCMLGSSINVYSLRLNYSVKK